MAPPFNIMSYIRSLIETLQPADRNQSIVVYSTGVGLITYTAIRAYHNYRAWLSIGPGGVPYNLIGWLAQGALTVFTSNDMISTAVYNQTRHKNRYGEAGQKSYFDMELPQRRGTRPFVPGFVAPQRQAPGQAQSSTPDMQQRQNNILKNIVASNPTLLCLHESHIERRGNAIGLLSNTSSSPDSTARAEITSPLGTSSCRGEIAHFHLTITDVPGWKGEADGSGHVTLSLADAKEVVAKGWGQRHRGSGLLFPLGYTFLYAPRDEEEINVLERIVMASVKYMTNGALTSSR